MKKDVVLFKALKKVHKVQKNIHFLLFFIVFDFAATFVTLYFADTFYADILTFF